MEPMEVIDLSSDDEKSPPKKRDTQSSINNGKKERAEKNDCDDVKIVYNVVKKRKQTNENALENLLRRKRVKTSVKEYDSRLISNLIDKKSEISISKITRIKPETLSPQCRLKFSESQNNTKSDVTSSPSSRTNGNADSPRNNVLRSENKPSSPESRNGIQSFKINEGASSSTQTNQLQLAVMNKISINDSTETILLPSKEMIESFFDACLKQDSSKDMKKIISKLRKRYDNLQPSYAKSGSFMQLIQKKKDLILNNRAKLYLHISEVMDEMKARQIQNRSLMKDKNKRGDEMTEISTEPVLEDVPEEDQDLKFTVDPKNYERLRALEKAMRRCERRINTCEQAEVNFDDENDSHYIMAVQYKRRMVELYNKYCEITGEQPDAARPYLRPKNLDVTPLSSLNNAITSFINKKIMNTKKSLTHGKKKSTKSEIRLTDALVFPDYVDILKCLEKCNDEENLGIPKMKQEEMAKDAFTKLGDTLKRYREADYYDTFSLYLDNEGCDPATTDESLNEQLTKNQELGKKRMDQVFQEFVEKQDTAKYNENVASSEKGEDQETGDDSSDGTDEEDSDPGADDEIGIDLNIDCNESETDDVLAIQHDDSNEKDNDIESDKPKDDLQRTGTNESKVENSRGELDESVIGNVELDEPQDDLPQKINDTVDLDITPDVINKESNNDNSVDLDITQDVINKESKNDDAVDLDIMQDDNNIESNSDVEMDAHADTEKEIVVSQKLLRGLRSLSVEKNDEKSIDLETSEINTDTTKYDMEVTVENDITEVESNCETEKNIQPPSPTRASVSTVAATCKVNLMQTTETSETNMIDECSPVIPTNNTKVIDAPPVVTTIKLIDNEEEKKPVLRLRQFAKPPGSWKDFQSPSNSPIKNTLTVGKGDLETKTKETIRTYSNTNKFLVLNKPISIDNNFPVNNGFLMNLKNKISSVMIPMNIKNNLPQINVKNFTNNVILNFNNQARLQPRVKSPVSLGSGPCPNMIKIDKSGKINTLRNNMINISPDKERTSKNSHPIQRQQMAPIRIQTSQVRFVGQNTSGISPQQRCHKIVPLKTGTDQERRIIRNISPIAGVNGKRTTYRLVQRSPVGRQENIIRSAKATVVQNQKTPRNLDQISSANRNSPVVVDSKSIRKVSSNVTKIYTSVAPSRPSNRADKVYEASDGVPTYVID